VRLEFAHVLSQLRRFDETLDQVDAVLRLTEDPCVIARALRKRGYVQFERGELREAFKTFRKSQTYEPKSPVARNELQLLFGMMQDAGLPPADFTPPPTTQSAHACSL